MNRRLIHALCIFLAIMAVTTSYAAGSGSLLLRLVPKSEKVKIPPEITVTLRNTSTPGMDKGKEHILKVKDLTAALENVAPATYGISIKGKDISDFAGKAIIEENKQTEFNVQVERVFALFGKVLDRKSQPVANAQILARKDVKITEVDRFTFFAGAKHATSDEKGIFKLTGLVEGPYKLRISHPDMIMQTDSVKVLAGKNPPLVISMRSGLQITGKVLEADGSPAAGVTVVISGPVGRQGVREVNRTANIDSKGYFSQSGLTMGKYNVMVQNAQSRQQERIVRDVFAGTTDMEIKLQKKCVVRGTVKGPDGKSVSDAEISFRKITLGKRMPGGREDNTGIKTDAEGNFRLLLRYGQKYEIKSTKRPLLPGIATLMVPEKITEEVKPVNIVMQLGEVIQGTVVSAKDASPIKNLAVRINPTAGLGFMLKEEVNDDAALTDKDGKFTIKGLRPGVSKLVVTPADDSRWILTTKQVLVKKGPQPNITIPIKEPGTVKGNVSLNDFDGKKPRVSMHNPSNPQQHFSADVDDKGNFKLDNVPPGNYIVTAMASMTPGGAPGPMGGMGGGRAAPLTTKITVKSGQTAQAEIKKDVKKSGIFFPLKGTVLKKGKPFGIGTIEFAPTKPSGSPGKDMLMFRVGKSGKLDEESRFVIDKMEAGEFVYVVRPAPKDKQKRAFFMQKTYSGVVKVKMNQKEITIDIDGSTLEGVVRNKNGLPVGGVNVIVSPEGVDGIMKQRLTRHCQADAEGKYSLDCINPGTYSINTRNKQGSASASERGLKISRKLHNLDLSLKDNCKIYGKVTIPETEKMRGVSTVAVSCEDYSIPGYGSVDETGNYTITPQLPPGDYFVFSFKDGYAVSESKITLEKDTEVNGTLVPGGAIKVVLKSATAKNKADRIVRVKTSEGKEVLRCRKPSQWTRSGGPWSKLLIAPTDTTGSTTVAGLKEGKYTVSVDGSDKTASCTVKALEETVVEIDI